MSTATMPLLGIAQCVTLTAFTTFGIKIQPLLYFAAEGEEMWTDPTAGDLLSHNTAAERERDGSV